MHPPRFAALCVAVLAALCATPVLADPPSATDVVAIERFDSYLTHFRVEKQIPALAVAILRDGEVLWEKAYGWSDDEGEVAATVDTTFSIASVTKPIAAVAILAEADAGRLDLAMSLRNDPAWTDTCEWLAGSKILFGSGGTEEDGTPVPKMDCSRDTTLRDILDMRVNGDGSSFVYNPISYARIDRVISGGGGRDLRDIVRERVMDKAGIHGIALGWRDPHGGSALRLLAPPFMLKEGELAKNTVSDDDFRAAAGIKASVRQLARFDMALDAGNLLTDERRARIFDAPVMPAAGDYRHGWFVQGWQGHRLAWHSGWDPERYSAIYLKVPDSGLTLVVLANTEALWWDNSLARAEIETSPVVAAFLSEFVEQKGKYESGSFPARATPVVP